MDTKTVTVKNIDYTVPVAVSNVVAKYRKRFWRYKKTIKDLRGENAQLNEEINQLKKGA